MRLNRIIIAAVLIFSASVSLVHAQREGGALSIGVFGSASVPLAPGAFKDIYNHGYGFGGVLHYHLTGMTGLAASYSFQPFKLDTDNFIEAASSVIPGGIPEGVTVDVIGGDVKGHIIALHLVQYFTPPSSPFGLYIVGGGGYYSFKPKDAILRMTVSGSTTEEPIIQDEDADAGFGVSGGLGLGIMFGSTVGLYCQGIYHHTFVDAFEDAEDMGLEAGKVAFIQILGGILIIL